MTDWLRNIPVYHHLNEAQTAMNEAVRADEEEHEMTDRDTALVALTAYLAEHYVSPLFREWVLQILDVYCGKPIKEQEG